MPGHSYIAAVQVRLSLIYIKLRASKGKPAAPTDCDLGCGRPDSLAPMLQYCPMISPERIKLHDNVLTLLVSQLIRMGVTVWRQPMIRTLAGARRPNIVLFNSHMSAVLDVQVVSDSAYDPTLERAHKLKFHYSNTVEIISWVFERSGLQPLFSTGTINWRELLARASHNVIN